MLCLLLITIETSGSEYNYYGSKLILGVNYQNAALSSHTIPGSTYKTQDVSHLGANLGFRYAFTSTWYIEALFSLGMPSGKIQQKKTCRSTKDYNVFSPGKEVSCNITIFTQSSFVNASVFKRFKLDDQWSTYIGAGMGYYRVRQEEHLEADGHATRVEAETMATSKSPQFKLGLSYKKFELNYYLVPNIGDLNTGAGILHSLSLNWLYSPF